MVQAGLWHIYNTTGAMMALRDQGEVDSGMALMRRH